MIQIIDHKQPMSDVAGMQFSVEKGEYPNSDTLAFCVSLEIARATAHGVAEPDEPIVIREY